MIQRSERSVAALGTLASAGALFSAAACCVLPLALAGFGLGVSAFAPFVPYHWPLTIGAAVAVAIGWMLYLRKRRACAADAECEAAPPAKATFILLWVATAFVALSAIWPGYLEQPLTSLLTSA